MAFIITVSLLRHRNLYKRRSRPERTTVFSFMVGHRLKPTASAKIHWTTAGNFRSGNWLRLEHRLWYGVQYCYAAMRLVHIGYTTWTRRNEGYGLFGETFQVIGCYGNRHEKVHVRSFHIDLECLESCEDTISGKYEKNDRLIDRRSIVAISCTLKSVWTVGPPSLEGEETLPQIWFERRYHFQGYQVLLRWFYTV